LLVCFVEVPFGDPVNGDKTEVSQCTFLFNQAQALEEGS
jgi:hypothetical protein